VDITYGVAYLKGGSGLIRRLFAHFHGQSQIRISIISRERDRTPN
jgi:hypothetical protein